MRIVLDTNVLLISIPTISKYRVIFNAIIEHKIELVISNEILSEYIEKIEEKSNQRIAINLAELLTSHRNILRIEPYFKWSLITQDYDDNKFVDVAIACDADYLVTNDKHFNELKSIEFPTVNLISANEFIKVLLNDQPKPQP